MPTQKVEQGKVFLQGRSIMARRCVASLNRMADAIKICAYVPGRGSTFLTVRRHEPIRQLVPSFNQDKVEFCFKGQILNPHQSFESYGIDNNDTVLLMRNGDPRAKQPGQSLAKECERLSDTMRMLDNPRTRIVTLSRFDLALKRLEMRPRALRKSLRRGAARDQVITSSSSDIGSLIIPEAPEEICEDPLPLPPGW